MVCFSMAIAFDTSLIRPYTEADNHPKPTTTRRYSNGTHDLLYINASHVDISDNPTIARVRETIEQFRPQRVVIEARDGVPLLENSEAAYTSALAAQYNIPVVRGEPSDTAIFAAAQHAGYSIKDVMALYLLRMIPQDRNSGYRMDEAAFAERANAYLTTNPAFENIPQADRLTLQEFRAIYAPRLGHADYLDATTQDFAPYLSADATYFQRLSGTLAMTREQLVDTKIGSAINEEGVSRVLVVYGGAHRTMSEPVWEAALGKGVDVETSGAAVAPPQRNDWSQLPRNNSGHRANLIRGGR